jgi:hypothetical protein
MRDIDTIDFAALRAPFAPESVDFRLQKTIGETKGIAIAYMDARLVQDRLDDVVGPANWSFDWTPLPTANGAFTIAKGTLTICGVSKSDVGDAGLTEPTKSTVSDALKRAAVMWGIGRYLYDLGTFYCDVDKKNIPDAEIAKMRAKLPRALTPTVAMLNALLALGAQLGRAVPANLTAEAASKLGREWQAELKTKNGSNGHAES